MAKEIDMETRERAEELYIIEGLTFEAVSQETGISVNTLKKWAKGNSVEKGWKDRRYEYRSSSRQIEEKMQQLRIKLVETAINDPDSYAAYKFTAVEKLILEKQKKKATETARDVEKAVKKGGLSDDAAEQIRDKILGIAR